MSARCSRCDLITRCDVEPELRQPEAIRPVALEASVLVQIACSADELLEIAQSLAPFSTGPVVEILVRMQHAIEKLNELLMPQAR